MKTPPLPPILNPQPNYGEKIKHVEKIKASRKGEFILFFLGLLTLPVMGLGLLFIIIAIIISICKHDTKVVSYRCSSCGNEVVTTSKVCPACRVNFIK